MNRLTTYEQLQTPPASIKSIKQNMRRSAANKTRTDNRVHVPFVVASSHIGFQVVHEHERVVQRQDGNLSRWHQHATAAAVDGDLPPAKPSRHAGGTAQNSKNNNQDENLAGQQRETTPRKARPKWLTQVFQPAITLTTPTTKTTATPASTVTASSTKKETASSMLSPRQEEQRKDMPDCQPSRPKRQLRRDAKCPAAVVVSSDASNTHATEEITEHEDDDGDFDDFDDDISDLTPEDYSEAYSESVIYSDVSQSYIRPNNNSNSIPPEVVSASKARETSPDSTTFTKTTEECRPALIATNTLEAKLELVNVAQEATAAKYRKMLHMQVPKEAVRQKMMVDGVDPKIVRLVVGESAPASTIHACAKKDPSSIVILASTNQNQISQACALQKMQANDNDKDESKNENKLVALHWTPLSGKDLDHSVWMANTHRQSSLTAQGSDFSKLVELFKKKPKTCLPLDGKGKKLSTFKSRSSAPRANLLDLSRCNNVAISLRQFKEFTPEDLRDIIAFLDPMQRIRGERVEFLRGILPTVSDARKVDAYEGNENCLVPTEIWFRRVARIQRLERKVEVITTMEGFTFETAVLDKKLQLLSQVCHQVMSSEKLQNLLDMVLQVGNTLNAGTRTGGAAGFKFDSLLKLTQTKSSDGKITVLDFVVTLFATHGHRDSLKLLVDFPECHAAARLPVSDLLSQIVNLQHALQICEDELKALKEELSGHGAPRLPKGKTTFKLTKKCEPGDARGNLMASLLSRCKGTEVQEPQSKETGIEKNSQKTAHRDLLRAPIKQGTLGKSFKAAECGDTGTHAIDATTSDFQQSSLQGGIVRLEEFLCKGKETLVELDSSRNFALDACSSFSKYCGEGCDAATASSTLLGILAQFASNVEAALIQFDRQQKAETRRQKTQGGPALPTEGGEAPPTSSPGKTDESSGQEKSLVLLVNEWLNDANDRTVERGMHASVTEKLNAIYEKEKTTTTSGVVGLRRAAPWRSDLVMERDGKMEQ